MKITMNNRIKRILSAIAVLVLTLAVLVAASAIYSARTLIVTQYEIPAPVHNQLRIVQLSDLHSREFGEHNQKLIDKVSGLNPDMIVMTGDMMNEDDLDLEPLLRLIKSLQAFAPVYYCYGNHETSWMSKFCADLRPSIESSGATVLNTEFVDLALNGSVFRLGGYANYYRQPHMLIKNKEQIEAERRFADEFEDTQSYKILLCHIPTSWLDWSGMDRNDVDLVLCGHYHGGQVRFPWGGGLYAPYVGVFPPYTKGMFVGEKALVVLSAGLGSQRGIPRINNPGEIVCVDLIPEK